jgi:hypothetical protein
VGADSRKTSASTEVAVVEQPTAAVVEQPSETPEKRQNYNRLVRTVRLVSILLDKIECKVSPEAFGINKALLTRDLLAKQRTLVNGATDGTCIANIVWTTSLKYKKKSVAKCMASYIITYDGMKGCNEESIETFIENVAKTATYAYFRALYAHLDWSANLGSAPLPVLQFQPKI